MLPYFTAFGQQISSYTLMAVIGFFSMWLAAWIATRKQKDIDQNHVPHIALAAMAGLFIGAHILYGIVNFGILIRAAKDHFSLLHSFGDYAMLFVSVFGGMVFYGGLFGAIVGAVMYIRAVKLPSFPYMDVMASFSRFCPHRLFSQRMLLRHGMQIRSDLSSFARTSRQRGVEISCAAA